MALESDDDIGNDESDGAVFARVYVQVRRLAAVVAPSDVDPDDLVQAAVEHSLQRGPLSDLDDPLRYLRRAVVNLSSNERRTFVRRKAAMVRLGSTESVDDARPSDLSVLDELTPINRAVVYLSLVEGRGSEEVGELLDLSPTAVRARLSRSRHALRSMLENER